MMAVVFVPIRSRDQIVIRDVCVQHTVTYLRPPKRLQAGGSPKVYRKSHRTRDVAAAPLVQSHELQGVGPMSAVSEPTTAG